MALDPTTTLEPTSDDDEIEEASGTRSPGDSPALGPAPSGPLPRSSSMCSTPSTSAPFRLGLQFRSGQTSGAVFQHNWRDGRFSDWHVKVGEKSYHLHAFLLARASLFFESHMSMAARTEAEEHGTAKRGSDLSEVLPRSCHAAFELALDFIYSENQAAFEAPASKALLLLKIADILGIAGLFNAMGKRIDVAFSDTAPLLLEQYCRFHIPGTDDGAALRQIRDGAVELIVRKFQAFLANPEMRTAMLRLPAGVLAEILEADELRVAGEDIVFDFVAARLQGALMEGARVASSDSAAASAAASAGGGPEEQQQEDAGGAAGSSRRSSEGGSDAPPANECDEDMDSLWKRVRWAYLSVGKFGEALSLGRRLLRPEVALDALTARIAKSDLSGSQSLTPQSTLMPPRRPILPPGVPPPTSTEIDFCFHFAHAEQFNCGDALRSQPKRIGDMVLRVLVFPAGTDTGVAKGSLSVFLEAVPQPRWTRDWEFTNIRYAIACIRWPTGSGETWAAKRKSDLWTFKANRLDRGWHDFLAPGEIHKYLGPDGFVCIRGSLEPECLGRTFLLSCERDHGGYPGALEASGSSGSRRSWAPRPPGATPPSASAD